MTASRSLNFTGQEDDVAIPGAAFTGLVVGDQVCLSASLFRICSNESEFYALVEGTWDRPNIFGVMPPSLETGPNFIKDLAEQGMIEEQVATININPYTGN